MPYYKNKVGNLFWLDSEEFEHFLHEEVMKISDAEGKEIELKNNFFNDRKAEIFQELKIIDEQSVRPARAVAVALAINAVPDTLEIDKLTKLEARAQALRSELSTIN